ARGVHAARHMERLHVAADRARRPGPLHAAGGACEPGPRARAGQRADDGRRRRHDAAHARAVPRAAALLPTGPDGGKRQGMKRGWLAWLALVATTALAQAQIADSPRLLDSFDDLPAWKPAASNGVAAKIETETGPHGPALRLDFDLGGTAGYALAAR